MHVETATTDDKARGAKRPVTAIGAALIGAGVMSTLAAQAPMAVAAPVVPAAPIAPQSSPTPRPTVVSDEVNRAAIASAAKIPASKWVYATDADGNQRKVLRSYTVNPKVGAPAPSKTTDSGLTNEGYTAADVPTTPANYSPNSIAYIPENIGQVLLNIPAVEYQALNMTAEAFENSDNWWLYIPTNVVGFDQQDKQKFEGMTLAMVPVPLVAKANYDQWWLSLAANAPMTENCTGIPGPCSDVFYFDQYGTVPTWKLIEGYTFPEIKNTIDPDHDTYVTPNGRVVKIQPDWSGKTYKLDPFGPQKAIWQTLTQKPTGVQRAPSAGEWAKAFDRMGKAMWIGLNPNVDGTFCLPCQWAGTATGAPGSLPKQYLFGEYYTFFDAGQPMTQNDWVVNRPDYDPTTREDYVKINNGLDPKVQRHLIEKYNEATTPKALRESFAEFHETVRAVGEVLNKNIAENIEGLQRVLNGPVPRSGNELLDQINRSFHAPSSTTRVDAPETTVPAPATGPAVTKKRAAAQVSAPDAAVSPTPAVSNVTRRVAPPADPIAALGQQVTQQIQQAITPRKSPNVIRSSSRHTMQTLIPGGRHHTVETTDSGKHRALDVELAGAKHRA